MAYESQGDSYLRSSFDEPLIAIAADTNRIAHVQWVKFAINDTISDIGGFRTDVGGTYPGTAITRLANNTVRCIFRGTDLGVSSVISPPVGSGVWMPVVAICGPFDGGQHDCLLEVNGQSVAGGSDATHDLLEEDLDNLIILGHGNAANDGDRAAHVAAFTLATDGSEDAAFLAAAKTMMPDEITVGTRVWHFSLEEDGWNDAETVELSELDGPGAFVSDMPDPGGGEPEPSAARILTSCCMF